MVAITADAPQIELPAAIREDVCGPRVRRKKKNVTGHSGEGLTSSIHNDPTPSHDKNGHVARLLEFERVTGGPDLNKPGLSKVTRIDDDLRHLNFMRLKDILGLEHLLLLELGVLSAKEEGLLKKQGFGSEPQKFSLAYLQRCLPDAILGIASASG